MSDFLVPAGAGESELTEKRSRFLGHLLPVETEEDARAFLAEMKRKYHDARHNCWCYRIHDGAERFSDDGEPQGSAGMPMLEVFRKENIENYEYIDESFLGMYYDEDEMYTVPYTCGTIGIIYNSSIVD